MTAPIYPADDVLIARGKYSTLTSEKKTLMRAMQKDVEALANHAHRILRAPEDQDYAQNEANCCYEALEKAQEKLDRLAQLKPLIDELHPLAWGKAKEDF